MTMEIRSVDGYLPVYFEFHKSNNVLLRKVDEDHWNLHVDEVTISIKRDAYKVFSQLVSTGSMIADPDDKLTEIKTAKE